MKRNRTVWDEYDRRQRRSRRLEVAKEIAAGASFIVIMFVCMLLITVLG